MSNLPFGFNHELPTDIDGLLNELCQISESLGLQINHSPASLAMSDRRDQVCDRIKAMVGVGSASGVKCQFSPEQTREIEATWK